MLRNDIARWIRKQQRAVTREEIEKALQLTPNQAHLGLRHLLALPHNGGMLVLDAMTREPRYMADPQHTDDGTDETIARVGTEPAVSPSGQKSYSITQLYGSALRRALSEVEYGHETVVVTRHGKPIAKFTPITDDVSLTDPTAQLVSIGKKP